MTSAVRLTCKSCGKAGYLKDFDNCAQVDCKLTMAKNNKPPAILAPVNIQQPQPHRHHPMCMCNRCLDQDVKDLEDAYTKFKERVITPIPVQVPIRVIHTESPVKSECEDGDGAVYLEVPTVLCCSIYPKGKRK